MVRGLGVGKIILVTYEAGMNEMLEWDFKEEKEKLNAL